MSRVVPLEDIIERLKRDYQAAELPQERIPQRRMQLDNAYYYGLDEKLDFAEENLCIRAIRIPVTEKTRHYTQKDFIPWGQEENGDIYVVYEKNLGYFQSNSNKLFLEIAIARGISQADIENKSEKYKEYLWRMQCYLEDYSDLGNSVSEALVWSQEMRL